MFTDFLRTRMTFSAKLYLATVLIVLMVATSLIGVFALTQSRALDRAMARQGISLSEGLAESVRVGLILGDPAFIRDATRGIQRLPDLRFATFFDAAGRPVLQLGAGDISFLPTRQWLAESTATGTLVSILPTTEGTDPTTVFVSSVSAENSASVVGYIALGISQEAVLKEQHHVLAVTLGTGGLLLGIACLVTYLLIRNLVRPLKTLAQGARRIGKGDMEVVIAHAADDDLGRLADDFNAMTQSLRQASAALTRSEKKYRELFEEIELPLYILDARGRFIDFNDALQRLSGQDPIIRGETFCPLLTHDGKANALMDELFASPKGIHGRTVEWRRGDGEVLQLIYSARVRRDEADQPVAIEGMLTDITALKSLEAQLLQSQKLESLGTLAGGVAHNFNNLLGSMMACSERLLMKTDPTDPNYEWLVHLQKAGQRGADLSRDLLRFARQDESEKKPFVAGELVAELVQLLRATINPRIRIEQHLADDTWLVLGDQGQIHQVLLNLCVNARDAIEDASGRHLTVHVKNTEITAPMAAADPAVAPGRYVKISVRDDGTGIPQAVRERVFDPFFTTKPQGKGTGQGLSSAYGMVSGHGGFITFESEEGIGTVFNVFLPPVTNPETREPVTPIPAAPNAPEQRDRPGGDGAEKWMLLAEDQGLLRESLAHYFQGIGYRVLTANTGDEAILALETHGDRLSIVVSDAMMPGAGVMEISRRLKEKHPDLPLVLMSGYPREILEAQHGPLLCDLFLMKPFTLVQINFELKRLLGIDEARR